jgi:hypothetical protein
MFDSPTQVGGADFTTGKWLLNEIDAPVDIKQQLTTKAISSFKSLANTRISYIHDVNGLLLPRKIGFQLTGAELKNIKTGSGFDYLINIQAKANRDDYSAIDITPHKFDHGGRNESEVSLVIYNLNNGTITYSQKVVGSVTRRDDNSDVHFSKSNLELIMGAYNKIFNDLENRSAK